jgi:hypothetical protein
MVESKLSRLLLKSKTQKLLLVKEVQDTEENKTDPDQERSAPHGLTVLPILQSNILTQVLKATSAEIQYHMRVPNLFGASLKEVLQGISGSTVIQFQNPSQPKPLKVHLKAINLFMENHGMVAIRMVEREISKT